MGVDVPVAFHECLCFGVGEVAAAKVDADVGFEVLDEAVAGDFCEDACGADDGVVAVGFVPAVQDGFFVVEAFVDVAGVRADVAAGAVDVGGVGPELVDEDGAVLCFEPVEVVLGDGAVDFGGLDDDEFVADEVFEFFVHVFALFVREEF